MLEKKIILGVGISNSRIKEILEYIITGLGKNTKKYFIVTPNPEILTLASKDINYKDILNRAKIALADGIGVIIAGKILGKSFKARVTGVDLLENLCERVSEKPITVGFLGGKDGVADKTAECLVRKYPGLKVGFVASEWTVARGPVASFPPASAPLSDPSDQRVRAVGSPSTGTTPGLGKSKKVSLVSPKFQPNSVIDILFVAFGAPKQEMWIYENLDKIPIRVAIGVGGAFDYISGKVPRAPLFVRKVGLEWLFRLIIEPWRIRRQMALLEFGWLVLKEKFSSHSKT